jgi:hypothetical protein
VDESRTTLHLRRRLRKQREVGFVIRPSSVLIKGILLFFEVKVLVGRREIGSFKDDFGEEE